MKDKNPNPPEFVLKFFRWFCHPDLAKYIEGDLIELFQERTQQYGPSRAKWIFVIDVILLIRPDIIRSSIGFNSNNNYAMFKNYLKIGYRNLWKDRFYTSINLFGLSMGLACSFLVLLLVSYEFSFENFYESKDKIFRLGVHYNVGGKEDTYSNVPRPMGPAFKVEFPEVVDYTRMRGVNGLMEHKAHLKFNEKYHKSNKIFIVDSTFFNVFDTRLLKGSKELVLNRPNTVVLSKSLAKNIFGKSEPVGQKIEIAENGRKLEVTGIFDDIPQNTHIPYDALVSWNNYFDGSRSQAWYGAHVYTYVKLHDSDKPEALVSKFPGFFEKYMSTTFKEINGTASLVVQPIGDIHLKSDLIWEPNANGDLNSVFVLLAIGIFLVVIAQVNYLNLSLARSTLRKKEISVRMVSGASRSNISNQFIIETLLFTSIAFLCSLVIIRVIYGEFLNLSGIDVKPFEFLNLSIFAAVTFGIGLLVSLYPSFVLASSQLLDGLKSKSKSTRKGSRLKKTLVVFQFAISTIVILFTFVVQNQLDFVLNKDLGFQKENIVAFQLEDTVLLNKVVSIKERVGKISGVNSTSFASNKPGIDLNHAFVGVQGKGDYENIGVQFMNIDERFESTVGLRIIEGRNFIRGSDNDTNNSFMINEAAKQKFGWSDNPIGRKIEFGTDQNGNPNVRLCIGVFKDFNVSSLHSKIDPIIVFFNPESGDQLLVKISSNNQKRTVNEITQILDGYSPSIPVKYEFLDVELDRMYGEEKRLSKSMTYLSGLTILISILGFIGLLSYSINQREKEIGIRKVLGAKVSDVTIMFYKEIFILVLIGEILAFPINHYISNQWLESFQYQSYPGVSQFILILVSIIIFSLVTMGFQIIKVAFTNPAEVIQDE